MKVGTDIHNEVKIVDKSHLQQDFRTDDVRDQRFIDDTIGEFFLNEEQQRAFKIIANHATLKNAEQLKMYIGGMGGTGKSQVIKALIKFFEKRQESHRLIIVAPTGSAAALLAGSTYHSVLGINDNFSAARSVAQIQGRLDGVDYVFLDEYQCFHAMTCIELVHKWQKPQMTMTYHLVGKILF